jgi:hypothetical protein
MSLHGVGSPQFPTGSFVSSSDPHFRHRGDKLFWLDSQTVATTFFRRYSGSGGNAGVEVRAAVFGIADKRISTHDWVSRPDKPPSLGGGVGFFEMSYHDHIDLLRPDFTLTRSIAVSVSTSRSWPDITWSTSVNSFAVGDGGKVSLYEGGSSSSVESWVVPKGAWIAAVREHSILFNNRSAASCGVIVLYAGSRSPWNLDDPADKSAPCTRGKGLISEDAVLVDESQSNVMKVIHRSGAVDSLTEPGELLGVSSSGRIALKSFRPNPIAERLDMDFGGQKTFTVYDPLTKTTLFHKRVNGQGGAALSPDGHHIAIIENSDLLVYEIP